jgi:hypothetical protein
MVLPMFPARLRPSVRPLAVPSAKPLAAPSSSTTSQPSTSAQSSASPAVARSPLQTIKTTGNEDGWDQLATKVLVVVYDSTVCSRKLITKYQLDCKAQNYDATSSLIRSN